MEEKVEHYDESDIQILKGLEAERDLVCISGQLLQEGYIILYGK